jgi:hypothetical protein
MNQAAASIFSILTASNTKSSAMAETGVTGISGLHRLGAVAAIVGGSLRFVSSFIAWRANDAGLEVFYGVIDVCLLFGLIGVYVHAAGPTGRIGLAAFIVALIGMASLVGPDASAFGIDFYRLGCLVLLLGLAAFSAQMLRAGVLRLSALCWIGALALSLCGAAASMPLAIVVAGAMLGAGFLLAGVAMLRR